MNNIILSDKQKEIVSFYKGPLLVKASAGSGKTRVLTERICMLAKSTKRRILAITFSNRASGEIKDRLDSIDDTLLEKVYVGTFHSFCNYVLEKHGAAIGYKELPQVFSEMDDRMRIVEKAIAETPSLRGLYEAKDTKERTKFKAKALEVISTIKREVILDEDLESSIKDDDIILLYYNYREIMTSLNAIDFDDLLFLTYKLFITNPNIAALYRRNFEYIFVDEAQDLNRAQYLVLRALTPDENTNVMLVGDSNQSIYGFNGSSADFMNVDFVKDYSPKVFILNENYRSSKSILKYANRIIPGSTSLDGVVLEGISEEHGFESVEEETLWVIDKIKLLLNKKIVKDIEGEICSERIAILARNKYVLLPIEENLKKENLPYYYKSSSKGLELSSVSGSIFNLALQVRVNSKDSLHLSQLLNLVGLKNISSLDDLIKQLEDGSLYHETITTILKLKEDGSNFKKSIRDLLQKIEAKSLEITEEEELHNAHNDFGEILNHWLNYEKSTIERTLISFRNAMALGQTVANNDDKGITLSTVHTMKGQENDIVFLVGMDDMTFPDYRAIEKGGVNMQQEKNNLYVAVTRAKRYLFVTYPLSRIMPWGSIKERVKSRLLPK